MRQVWSTFVKRSYWLFITVAALQIVAIVAVVHYGRDSGQNQRSLLDLTGTMVNEIVPGIQSDLLDVSHKASEIKRDVQGVRKQLSAVDERLGDVGRGVYDVSRQVEGLDQTMTGYVRDQSGLVWGHSLNPYVLLGLLILIAALIPFGGWALVRTLRPKEVRLEQSLPLGPFEIFSSKLYKLHVLLEQINAIERGSEKAGPELQKLMEQTEVLIEETRAELAMLSHLTSAQYELGNRNPENLH